MHDELGDHRLSSARPLGPAPRSDALERWQPVRFLAPQYFNIDYGWADPELGYRHFDRRRWPEGPDRVLRRIREAGMPPGLWCAVNGGHMQVPTLEPSRSSARWHYSLLDGPFYDDLSDAPASTRPRCGASASSSSTLPTLRPVCPGDPRPLGTRYAMGVERFVALVARLERSVPQAITIAHCGFARQDLRRTARPRRAAAGCGPRLCWRSLTASSAAIPQVSRPAGDGPRPQRRPVPGHPGAGLMVGGFPLHRIEDHGVLCGLTNTCPAPRAGGPAP